MSCKELVMLCFPSDLMSRLGPALFRTSSFAPFVQSGPEALTMWKYWWIRGDEDWGLMNFGEKGWKEQKPARDTHGRPLLTWKNAEQAWNRRSDILCSGEDTMLALKSLIDVRSRFPHKNHYKNHHLGESAEKPTPIIVLRILLSTKPAHTQLSC